MKRSNGTTGPVHKLAAIAQPANDRCVVNQMHFRCLGDPRALRDEFLYVERETNAVTSAKALFARAIDLHSYDLMKSEELTRQTRS
jgi:hypothetical protein